MSPRLRTVVNNHWTIAYNVLHLFIMHDTGPIQKFNHPFIMHDTGPIEKFNQPFINIVTKKEENIYKQNKVWLKQTRNKIKTK